MKLAVLAAEDAGFYEHAGLNYLGIFRALFKGRHHVPRPAGREHHHQR